MADKAGVKSSGVSFQVKATWPETPAGFDKAGILSSGIGFRIAAAWPETPAGLAKAGVLSNMLGFEIRAGVIPRLKTSPSLGWSVGLKTEPHLG